MDTDSKGRMGRNYFCKVFYLLQIETLPRLIPSNTNFHNELVNRNLDISLGICCMLFREVPLKFPGSVRIHLILNYQDYLTIITSQNIVRYRRNLRETSRPSPTSIVNSFRVDDGPIWYVEPRRTRSCINRSMIGSITMHLISNLDFHR